MVRMASKYPFLNSGESACGQSSDIAKSSEANTLTFIFGI
jgi:hypothetical protein